METTNLTDEHRATARELLAGASTWEAGARLVGNVTAGAIAALCLAVAGSFDFAAFADDKTAWSIKTFGPGKRAAGVIDHIRKELAEVEARPDDVSEWADLIILAMDGAARSAGADGEALVDALVAKMARNKARTWPDWRTMSEDRAIEHDRSGEAPRDLLTMPTLDGPEAAMAALRKRIDADRVVDRILGEIGDAPAAELVKGTVEREAVRQIVADVITAGQDAGREIVRLERQAALAAARRENDAAVLRELGTDASKWAPAFIDALMATPEPTVEDDDRDLTKWMRDQEALTLAWFANAIEIGRDAGVRQERDRARAEPAIAGATTRGDIERNLAIAVDQVSETFDAARAGFPWHGDAILGTVRGAVADALDLIHTQGARIADGRVPCPPGEATDDIVASVDVTRHAAKIEQWLGYDAARKLITVAVTDGVVAAQYAAARSRKPVNERPLEERDLGIEVGGGNVGVEPLLRLFRFEHLRPELRAVSAPFAQLAAGIATNVPRSAERTLALRAVWEAKNLAVVAVAQPPDPS